MRKCVDRRWREIDPRALIDQRRAELWVMAPHERQPLLAKIDQGLLQDDLRPVASAST